MAPYGGADALQDTNQALLKQIVDSEVFIPNQMPTFR